MIKPHDTQRQPTRPPVPAPVQPLRWLWPVAILAISVVVLVVLIILLALDQAFLLVALRVGIGIVIVGLFGAVALGLLWLLNHARRAAVVTMQHGQPIDVRDLRTLTQVTAAATLDRHYGVELARAERSAFPALSHYSVRSEGGAAAAPCIEGELVGGSPLLPPPAGAAPRLVEMAAQGVLRAQPASLLIGYRGNTAQTLPLDRAGFIAIAGQPRVGKSTTATLLLTQAALHGWHLALCDPHGHQADGLLRRCAAISGSCIRQAIEPHEIVQAISLVDKIGQRRIGGDRADIPLLLVIDEFTRLILRRQIPADILATLTAMAVEYSKVKVYGVLIGQDWTGDLLGGQLGPPLRRAITHRIIHRADPQNAEFLLPSPALARHVASLERGQALFWGDEAPAVVSVPQLGEDDLRYAAGARPPRPYVPRPHQIAPAAPPPTPATLADRIVLLLQASRQQLDSATIASQLGADVTQVRNALTQLASAGRVSRHGAPRSYTYSADSP